MQHMLHMLLPRSAPANSTSKDVLPEAALTNLLQSRCSKKFRHIYRKAPVLKTYFNKIAGHQTSSFIKKRLQHILFL